MWPHLVTQRDRSDQSATSAKPPSKTAEEIKLHWFNSWGVKISDIVVQGRKLDWSYIWGSQSGLIYFLSDNLASEQHLLLLGCPCQSGAWEITLLHLFGQWATNLGSRPTPSRQPKALFEGAPGFWEAVGEKLASENLEKLGFPTCIFLFIF